MKKFLREPILVHQLLAIFTQNLCSILFKKLDGLSSWNL